MTLTPFLQQVVQSPTPHARFLNSLSYLEYRGFRKIARSQRTEDIDADVLLHAMEEVRHALYFKRLALKVGGESFAKYTPQNMLAEQAVKAYFYDLDSGIDKIAMSLRSESRGRAIYQFVTWLIEERAMGVYREYDQVLQNHHFEFSLKPVLADEQRHLDEVRAAARLALADASSLESDFFGLEDRCFQRTWQAFAQELAAGSVQ